jgi:hypothetical protein
MSEDLDIQDYLDATGDSASRSRTVAISIVITCVLVFAGLLNSQDSNWMLNRIRQSSQPNSEYIRKKLGDPPPAWEAAQPTDGPMRYYDYRYKEFVSALSRAYVDSAMLVRVPFFGFVIDVNDLGLLGGITFCIMLILFRFSLSREVDNLNLSFAESARLDRLQEFYYLLAMRQMFTVPKTAHIKRTPLLLWTPKLICWLPLLLHCAVSYNDIHSTADIGELLSHRRFGLLVASEWLMVISLGILAVMTTRRLRRIDRTWDAQWECIQAKKLPKKIVNKGGGCRS